MLQDAPLSVSLVLSGWRFSYPVEPARRGAAPPIVGFLSWIFERRVLQSRTCYRLWRQPHNTIRPNLARDPACASLPSRRLTRANSLCLPSLRSIVKKLSSPLNVVCRAWPPGGTRHAIIRDAGYVTRQLRSSSHKLSLQTQTVPTVRTFANFDT